MECKKFQHINEGNGESSQDIGPSQEPVCLRKKTNAITKRRHAVLYDHPPPKMNDSVIEDTATSSSTNQLTVDEKFDEMLSSLTSSDKVRLRPKRRSVNLEDGAPKRKSMVV